MGHRRHCAGPVVASAPAAAAQVRATGSGSPSASRAARAPQNESPAAVVSTGVTANGSIRYRTVGVTTEAPRLPWVTITVWAPAASNPLDAAEEFGLVLVRDAQMSTRRAARRAVGAPAPGSGS